jgi:nucleotide-binding universal stress UspA family protein
MSLFTRIMVGLDLSSPVDEQLLQFLPLIAGNFPPPKVYFLHISYELQLPVRVGERYMREAASPSRRPQLQRQLEAKVAAQLDMGEYEGECAVLEGTITRQMLQYAEEKHIDLALLGRKDQPKGSGIATERFLRNSQGSVLFLPERAGKPPTLKRMLLTTDFSPYATHAFRQAIALAHSLDPVPVIDLLHVYDVPTAQAVNISRDRGNFSQVIRQHAESSMETFLQGMPLEGLDLEVHLQENTHFNTARHIIDLARKTQTDLIVAGARGQSTYSSLLLGLVTEKLLRYHGHIPLLIMRMG